MGWSEGIGLGAFRAEGAGQVGPDVLLMPLLAAVTVKAPMPLHGSRGTILHGAFTDICGLCMSQTPCTKLCFLVTCSTPLLCPPITDHRLITVNTIKVPQGVDWAAVVKNAMDKYSLEIAGGLGPTAGKVWRIGIMGESAAEQRLEQKEWLALCYTAASTSVSSMQRILTVRIRQVR